MTTQINPKGSSQRTRFRRIGGLLVVVGGIMSAIGLVSFFSAFGGGDFPDLFWCVFLGMPCLVIGLGLLEMGYKGALARYVSGETAPVAADEFNYVAQETRSGVRTMAASLAQGLQEGGTPEEQVFACPNCDHSNDAAAKYCDQCGAAMPVSISCTKCATVNDPDAQYCDGCGAGIRNGAG